MQPLPKEIQDALEDVKQIRSYFDKNRMNHPIRVLFQPIRMRTLFFTPFFAVYGVLSQWVLDSSQMSYGPLSKTGMLLFLFGCLCVAGGLTKYIVFRIVSKPLGYQMKEVARRVFFVDGYLRIVGSILFAFSALAIVFFQLGHPHYLVGTLALCLGIIMVMIPLALPLPEFTWSGVYFLCAGFLAMFCWPAYPFYKVAVIWPIGFVLFGLSGRKIAASETSPTPQLEETDNG